MAPTISPKASTCEVMCPEILDVHCLELPHSKHSKTSSTPVFIQSSVKETKKHLCHRIRDFFSKIGFEITCFSLTISLILSQVSSVSMILEKVCFSQYSEDICAHLQNYTEIKSSVERQATNYQVIYTLIRNIPGVFISLFVGSWSDKYGRKLPLQIAIIGSGLEAIAASVCAYYYRSKVEYYLISAAFMGGMGGISVMMTIIYSYAPESVTVEKRTTKYAFFEIAVGLAKPLGVAAGGWLFNFVGYTAVFIVTACCSFLSLLCVTFMLPETRGMDNDDQWSVKVKELLSCQRLKDSFTATVRTKAPKGRIQIALAISSVCILFITVATTTSNAEINYMYAHHQFDWGNTTFSTITSVYMLLTIVSLVAVLPILKRFRIRDATVGLVGTASNFTRLIGIGMAWKPIVYHIANILGLLQGCGTIAARSLLSKMVTEEDFGKVFSFVAIVECVLPIITVVIFSQVFNAFLDIYPGMPYILISALTVVPCSFFVWTLRQAKEVDERSRYEDIPGKNEWKS